MRAWLWMGLWIGCAPAGSTVVMRPPAPELSHAAPGSGAVARQVETHLQRVRGCYDEARAETRELSGLVDTRFVIGTDGHVHDVQIERDTSGHPSLAACIESRLSGLFFDPAPTEDREQAHAFVLCAPGVDFCGLGPVTTVDGHAHHEGSALAAVLGDRARDMRRCAAELAPPGTSAVVSVELTVEPDGRIMGGRVRETLPAESSLRRCAVGPLLGAPSTLAPDDRTRFRYTFVLDVPATEAGAHSSL
jgi:hypothetical protein